MNLAKFQIVTSAAATDDPRLSLVTDGNVATWWSSTGSDPILLTITLPLQATIGSAHLYLGGGGTAPADGFSLQWWDGVSWQPVPGATVRGNTEPMLGIEFQRPIQTDRIRIQSSDTTFSIRETALFAPASEPIALGTDVSLNLAKKRPVRASSMRGDGFATLAVDGHAGGGTGWTTGEAAGSNFLECDLPAGSQVAALQLFSGNDASAPIGTFSLQMERDGTWVDVPGASAAANKEPEVALRFPPVEASKVRLVLSGAAGQTVRELVLLPPGRRKVPFAPGTDVFRSPAPATRWGDRSDSYWHATNRAGGTTLTADGSGVRHLPGTDPGAASEFQFLYNYASDTYRIRNRATLRCLAAGSLEKTRTIGVVGTGYHAMPHERWLLVAAPDGGERIVNVWNGLALHADEDGAVSLRPPSDDPRQTWHLGFAAIFPKKGLADVRDNYRRLRVSWEYNWMQTPRQGELPEDVTYCPMWWNAGHLDQQPLRYAGWQREARPMALLGFNEPDLAIESNMTPEQAAAAWPLLEAADLPLLSPAPATSFSGWMDEFHNRMEARGHRTDFYGAHCYLDPFPDALVGYLTKIHEQWGKPVWLTEFAGFDTSGHARYSEEKHYRFLAEFLWRAEGLPWLERYSIFPFFIDPAPEPWDPAPDRRSAMFNAAGTELTSLGELYAAWDADRTIRPRTTYHLMNKATVLRLANDNPKTPGYRTIRASGPRTQWVFQPVEGTESAHIVSLWDGGKLGWNGESLSISSPDATGDPFGWRWVEDSSNDHGCFFIEHAASGRRLRMDRTPDKGAPVSVSISTAGPGTAGDTTRWRFIKPLRPGNPDGPMGLEAAAAENQIHLRWHPHPDTTSFDVKRATDPDGPYQVIATVTEPRYIDREPRPGNARSYIVSASGAEGTDSAPVSAVPGWVRDPGFEHPKTNGFETCPGGGAWSFGSVHGSNQAGVCANQTGYTEANPAAPQGSQVAFLQGTGRIRQTLHGLVTGRRYQVGFLAAQRGSFQSNGQTWDLMVDGEVIGSYAPPKTATGFVAHSAGFVANAPVATLVFAGTNTRGGDNTVLIDKVRIRRLPD